MTLQNLLSEKEVIQQALIRLRRPDCQDKGVSLRKLHDFVLRSFGIDIIDHVNEMIRAGTLLAAQPVDRPDLPSKPSMSRPEILESVSIESANTKYPMLYLTGRKDLTNALDRIVQKRRKDQQVALEIASGAGVPFKGGENVVAFDPSKRAR